MLDTVVWVRALMNSKSACGRALARADDYTILMSPDMSLELLTVIHRPELAAKLTREYVRPPLDRVMDRLSSSEPVRPTEDVRVCRDVNDDKFFSCALAGYADYIVSEDKDVLAVGEFRGIRTITAAQFIALLERDA